MKIKESVNKYLDELKSKNEHIMMLNDELIVSYHPNKGSMIIVQKVDLTPLIMIILKDEITKTKKEVDKYIKECFEKKWLNMKEEEFDTEIRYRERLTELFNGNYDIVEHGYKEYSEMWYIIYFVRQYLYGGNNAN